MGVLHGLGPQPDQGSFANLNWCGYGQEAFLLRSSVNSSLPDSMALVMAISTYSRSSPLNSPMEFQFREKRSDESMTKGHNSLRRRLVYLSSNPNRLAHPVPFYWGFRGLRDCEKDSDELFN